jgi:3-hydroxyisobutyrate dehydrogenase
MHVAVLGTGTMGGGIARTLLREGFDVTVWNRTREKATPLAEPGATVADSPAAAVERADAVITILFDEEAVAASAREFLPRVRPAAVWVQSATVGPAGARRLAALAEAAGVAFVDAPVVGTKAPAESGTLTVLASGSPAARDAVGPVFAAIGAKTVDLGEPVGAASSLKLACNAWVASLTAATAQSLALTRALDVDPALFLKTIAGGPADSDYGQLKGKSMIGGDFTPSFSLGGLVKDLGLMLSATDGTDFEDSLLRTTRALFESAAKAQGAGEDVAAVITSFNAGQG